MKLRTQFSIPVQTSDLEELKKPNPPTKEAKKKARIEQRRAKKMKDNPISKKENKMHDIDKPITLDDLTNPDKS